MTTSTDILNGKESILGYILRNRKFLIIAGIGIVLVLSVRKMSKKGKGIGK